MCANTHKGNITNQDYRVTIATTLKNYRKNKNKSLDVVAGVTEVLKAMLGQIERKESVPTVVWDKSQVTEDPFFC